MSARGHGGRAAVSNVVMFLVIAGLLPGSSFAFVGVHQLHTSLLRSHDHSAPCSGGRVGGGGGVVASAAFSAAAGNSKRTCGELLESGGGVNSDRARLAESIAREFDVRVSKVRGEYEGRLARQKDLHRYELAKQRVQLLEGMVPLSAHEAIVDSYEEQSRASLEQAAALSAAGLRAVADNFSARQKVAQAQLNAKDEDLSRASAELRDLSDSLSGLKRDIRTLREALGSQAARAEESRRALAREIRQNEVEPETRRAEKAEAGLSELRASTHRWLAMAHVIKLEAAADARATGYQQGQADGRSEAAADALELELSLRAELESLRGDFADHRTRSRQERLALTGAVAEATQDAYTMVVSAAAAGAAALEASRDAWRAEGCVDGVAEGLAEGFADGLRQGRAEGFREGFCAAGHADRVDTGHADDAVQIGRASAVASEFSTPPARAAGARMATDNDFFRGVVESADVRAAEQELRETFAAYVVSAHDQKLKFAEREKAAAGETARELRRELAAAREVLAQVLQERISAMEAKRDVAIRELAVSPSTATVGGKEELPSDAFFQAPSWLDAAKAMGERHSNAAFWQECG